MAIQHNTDYTSEGLNRLLGFYKEKPRITALLTAWLAEVQLVEDAMWDVWVDRILSSGLATGDLLDKIGLIVGQERDGLDDAGYTILITARIAVNRSNGRRGELLKIAGLLVSGVQVIAHDLPPASFYIAPMGELIIPPLLAGQQFLGLAHAAGVTLIFVWTLNPASTTFIFGSTDGTPAVPTASQSFGSVDGGVPAGGAISGVYQTNTSEG